MNKIERVESYCFDERYYRKIGDNGEDLFVPSVTYILGCAYPVEPALITWKSDVGTKRAEEILEETGTDGTFVHASIEAILKGDQIDREKIEKMFIPRRALKVMRCLKAFLDWHTEFKPQVISTEYIVWNEVYKYAGTVDLKCKIGEDTYLVDFKTSKSIHDSHKAQICAYNIADPCDKVALLHLGNTTKKKYSFLVLDDEDKKLYTEEWLQTNKLFQTLHPNAAPSTETFPDIFTLGC